MYYEDENNLYHYSYRKGDKVENVRDVDYTEVPNTAATADPWEEKKPKKNRLGLKIAALALACALIGGAAGAVITHHAFASARGSTQIEVSDRQVAEVRQVKVDGKQQLTMPEVYAANVNSVVSINVSTTTNVFGRTTESAASGSGFFITKDGYILTNYHVIEGASTVKVTAYDGTTYDAAVIGGDEDYDIAVIKVEGTNFQPVVIGKSGSVQIGETVAAVGNPLGELTFSMSQGIVSCVNRAINVDGKPFNMIQVDCSINPGNSGGPLFNSYGEVIGIVSAKYSSYSNTTVEGIGFAIPIDDVLAMVKDIMTNGYVTNKAYIGITPQTMNAQIAQQFRYDVTQGVFVCSVEPGTRCTGSTGSNTRARDGWRWKTRWARRRLSRAATAQATASRRGSRRTTRICRSSTRSCRSSTRRRAVSMTVRARRFPSAMRTSAAVKRATMTATATRCRIITRHCPTRAARIRARRSAARKRPARRWHSSCARSSLAAWTK